MLAFLSIAVTSCGNGTSTTPTSTPSEKTTTVEIDKEYAVSFKNENYVSITTEGLKENKAIAGSTISFSLNLTDDSKELISVYLDSIELFDDNGSYSFTMPNHNVDVTINTEEKGGDENTKNISNVNVDSLPSSILDLQSYFDKTIKAESKYLASGHIESTLDSYLDLIDLDVQVGKNDVLVVDGQRINNLNLDPASTHYRKELGKQNNLFYTIESTTSNSTSMSVTNTLTTKNIDDSTSYSTTSINSSDALSQYTSYGFSSLIKDQIKDIKEKVGNPESYTFYLTSLTKHLSEDKKSATISLKAIEKTYNGEGKGIELAATFDGDYFLTSASLEKITYDENSINDDLTIKNTANYSIEDYCEINAVRDYRKTLNKTDISKYAMQDYDISIDYKLDEMTSSEESVDNIVYNSSTLSFSFKCKDKTDYLITPKFSGVKEGEGYVEVDSLGNVKVLKEGEFTLIFDNGFGKTKEVKVISLKPDPMMLNVEVSSSVMFINNSITLTSSILPSVSIQDVTVEAKEESEGAVEITKNDDGTYSIKGIQEGDVTLIITSTANTKLSKEINVSVATKPTYEKALNTLTTMSMHGEDGTHGIYINFNSDGTGSYAYGSYSYYYGMKYSTPGSFKYSINQDTLKVTLSDVTYSGSTDNNLTSYSIVTNTSGDCSFTYYDYDSYLVKDSTLTVNAVTRVTDLNSL